MVTKISDNFIFHYERPSFISKWNDITVPYNNLYGKIACIGDETLNMLNCKKVITSFNKELNDIFFEALRYYFNMNVAIFIGVDKYRAYLKYKTYFKDKYQLFAIKEQYLSEGQMLGYLYNLFAGYITKYDQLSNIFSKIFDKPRLRS